MPVSDSRKSGAAQSQRRYAWFDDPESGGLFCAVPLTDIASLGIAQHVSTKSRLDIAPPPGGGRVRAARAFLLQGDDVHLLLTAARRRGWTITSTRAKGGFGTQLFAKVPTGSIADLPPFSPDAFKAALDAQAPRAVIAKARPPASQERG